MNFTCVILQVQDDGRYPLGIGGTLDAIDFFIVPLLYGFLLCVDIKIGICGVNA